LLRCLSRMKSEILLFYTFLFSVFASTSNGQSIRHTYRFLENLSIVQPDCGPSLLLAKANGSCPAVTDAGSFKDDALPCGINRKVYHTNRNWGLRYPNSEGVIGDTYTIQMYVKVTDWGATWARIIDFSNGQLDEGIYFKDKDGSNERCIDFYPSGIAGPCPYFNTSTYYLLTFTRNGSTGVMDVYVDNKLFVSYDDKNGLYVGKANIPIYIFRDDAEVPCESGEANFAYLSFSNQFSTQANVNQVFDQICYVANVNPSADFSVTPEVSCNQKSLKISYTGNIKLPSADYTFHWDWGHGYAAGEDQQYSDGTGPYDVKWSAAGVKTITLTIASKTCPDNKIVNSKQILVTDVNLTAVWEQPDCKNNKGKITLIGLEGTAPYQYSVDSLHFQNDPVFIVDPNTYTITVKDVNGCVRSKTLTIVPSEDALLQTIRDTVICAGQKIQLKTTSNATSFLWQPATGIDDVYAKDPYASPSVSTQYIVGAKKDGCNEQYATVFIKVIPEFTVKVTPDAQIDPGVPFQLRASSPELTGQAGISYAWTPPTWLNDPSIANPVATIPQNTKYTVRVSTKEGCSVTGQVNLSLTLPSQISVPSAFSPNGDGENESLRVYTNKIARLLYFKVYDRWGQVVFFTNEIGKAWDGKFNGSDPIAGTYVFKVKALTDSGKSIEKEGSVLLIR